MAKSEILVAYNCKFRYLQRNNPLIEEQRTFLKAGQEPSFKLDDFIHLYASYAKDLAIGENSDRAISLTEENLSSARFMNGRKWHIIPLAGKQGKPVTVIKASTRRRYDFSEDAAALYKHNIFAYEHDEKIVMIFHRQNGSGCKSVFLETANKALRESGLKLEMEPIIPLSNNALSEAEATKLTLIYSEDAVSSDIADNINGNRRKTKAVRELGLNLTASGNSVFKKIIKNWQLNRITSENAFVDIKRQLGDKIDYDDAEISLKIGKRTRSYRWNEVENLFGSYDITDAISELLEKRYSFADALEKCADNYYMSILEEGILE